MISVAVENLVPYSLSQPSIFKANQLLPVRDLKLLVRDYMVSCAAWIAGIRLIRSQQIAKNALTILINISTDREILECLVKDDQFLESLLVRLTVCQSPSVFL
jgi:hypothetical protein